MKKLLCIFIVLSTLILIGCEEIQPTVATEYSQPPSWLVGKWSNSSQEPEYILEVTSENITIYLPDETIFDFISLDAIYHMTIIENASLFTVTADASNLPTLTFIFKKHSPTSIEITIDCQGTDNDTGPISCVPYIESGELNVEIDLTIDDTPPTVLSLSCNHAGPLTAGTEVTIEADLQADTYAWYLDGEYLSGESEKVLSVNTSEEPLSIGSHSIICKVSENGYAYFDRYTLGISE